MKERKQAAGSTGSDAAAVKEPAPADGPAAAERAVDDHDDVNSGFGDWLRSPDGVAYMRLFVVANSLVMFMTISWPQITSVLEIIGEYFAEWK